MIRHEFDLRRDRNGGYSGGKVLEDADGDVYFVSGNSHGHLDRKYVSVTYKGFHITADRDLFEGLTKDNSVWMWGERAMSLLFVSLTSTQFLKLLDREYKRGFAAGAEDAKGTIREALGL